MRIVFSTGDIHGIGPEIILKSVLSRPSGEDTYVAAGSFKALEFYRDLLGLPVELRRIDGPDAIAKITPEPGVLHVLSVAEPETIQPGTLSRTAGEIAMRSLETAAALCRDGLCDALVTAPLHKEAIALAGYRNTGHTDFLADFFGVSSQIMLFVDPVSGLKVALATIHEPLSKVPALVRAMDLDAFFTTLAGSMRRDFRLDEPKIAVLGLNPHASDGGVMGSEEATVIRPAIERLSGAMQIDGPFPADGFFGAKRYRNYDLIVAMYHDQGLLPFKVLAFDTGINVTLGLPIVRTSPDHGTGFDKAGKGTASERSFLEATKLGATIARNRTQTTE
ncbi:4-hydroxythreonine-4-phosphate dehydrogenase PdxA [Chlorobaculum sp. MV4-Y]|jgi:4-hydroxythreonine-4-phosphate dehydrogenase|uniref:4-hydroxythreonine-4-phosphate dehydrogenase PdxA n=1 Tax=Chlorobaculum sp. MV4-Y TaxID=2976335 RepID=UPI0021AF855F|nr:4-hydroxythreonine-4-phosphate dehydrogenase PdxA [Chlorobaculum sp. MV4-Y]UWX57045.1 4-hydroxythreonine-4-phosphate dehydrogenase PdxA [Chlorobaculum sp. MV4-Y]